MVSQTGGGGGGGVGMFRVRRMMFSSWILELLRWEASVDNTPPPPPPQKNP